MIKSGNFENVYAEDVASYLYDENGKLNKFYDPNGYGKDEKVKDKFVFNFDDSVSSGEEEYVNAFAGNNKGSVGKDARKVYLVGYHN